MSRVQSSVSDRRSVSWYASSGVGRSVLKSRAERQPLMKTWASDAPFVVTSCPRGGLGGASPASSTNNVPASQCVISPVHVGDHAP